MDPSGDPHPWDLFLAHAGPDKAAAEALFDLLAREARVFLDSRCLEYGDEWDLKLPEAQQASLVTVVLVSSKTEKAYYQREEIAAAVAMARAEGQAHRVVPLYLDAQARSNGSVPYGLRLKHSLILSAEMTLAAAAAELLGLVKRLRERRALPAAAEPARGALRGVYDPCGILHQPPADWESPVRRNRHRFKLAAFDLDGTLLRGTGFEFSWEAVWRHLSFGKEIQDELKRDYRQRSAADPTREGRLAAYRDWCDKACGQFRRRGLKRDQLRELCQPLTLTRNCREALTALRDEGVVIAIISGGIHTFLEDKFPDFREYVDFVFINELVFSDDGSLVNVRASAYDFQGKAEALDLIAASVGCSTEETVFVGDHFNDEAIMLRAAKAIAYPPQDVVAKWAAKVEIADDDLMAIVPHVLVE